MKRKIFFVMWMMVGAACAASAFASGAASACGAGALSAQGADAIAARGVGAATATPPPVLYDAAGAAFASEDSLQRHPDRVAQRVRVNGVAKGAEGRTIRWRVAADPLSGAEVVLDEARIAADGTFSLQAMFRTVMSTTLEIDYYNTTLFVCPGRDYELKFHPYDYTLDRRMNVFFPGAPVPSLSFDILKPENERLNRDIWQFLTLYDEEIDERAYEQIAVYGQKDAVRRLMARTDSLEEAWGSLEPLGAGSDTAVRDFVGMYISYMLAALEEFAGLKNDKTLFGIYLKEAPLWYRHPAQMQFARAYYAAYFEAKCPIPHKRLINLLRDGNVQSVLDTMGVDARLVNRRWREWVYLMAVNEVLNSDDYPTAALEKQLAQLSENTVYPMHRQTALGLLAKQERLRNGPALKPYGWLGENGEAVLADTLLRGAATGAVGGADAVVAAARAEKPTSKLSDKSAAEAKSGAASAVYICVVKSDPMLSPDGSAQIYALNDALRREKALRGACGVVLVCDDDSASAYTYIRALKEAMSSREAGSQPTARVGDVAAPAAATATEPASPLSFYYFNRNVETLRDWEVYTFPSFIVLSPQGRLNLRFAPPRPDGILQLKRLTEPQK